MIELWRYYLQYLACCTWILKKFPSVAKISWRTTNSWYWWSGWLTLVPVPCLCTVFRSTRRGAPPPSLVISRSVTSESLGSTLAPSCNDRIWSTWAELTRISIWVSNVAQWSWRRRCPLHLSVSLEHCFAFSRSKLSAPMHLRCR